MKITNEMTEYIAKQNWDIDIAHDVVVKVLEYDGPEIENWQGWLIKIYNNELNSRYNKEARRRELEREHAQLIEQVHGMDDVRDPLEYMAAEDLIKRIRGLSPLLRYALERYIMGVPVEDLAQEESITENAVYQRIHQAKKEIVDGR